MFDFLKRAARFISKGVWRINCKNKPAPLRFFIKMLQFVTVSLRSFLDHRCSLHAAGLTYFTLLSIVPVLCLLLLFARTLGAGDFAQAKINEKIDALIAEVENAPIEAEDAPPPAECAQTAQIDAPQEQPASVADTLAKAKAEKKGVFDTFMSVIGKDDESKAVRAEQKKRAAQAFGMQAREISNQLFKRINEFNVDTLGWVGLAMLLWTVISTLGMVEKSCNEIWEVQKTRPLWKQCSLYVFISIVLPLLIAGALSVPVLKMIVAIINRLMEHTDITKYLGSFITGIIESKFTGFCLMYFFASSAFACFYIFMPNCKVMKRAAFKAGFITSVLFCGWLKLCAVAQVGIANSSALYGSFAFLPIVLAWVYVSWQIVLLGSSMTYAFECVHFGVPELPRNE